MEKGPSWKADSCSPRQEIPFLMGTQDSLPNSQQPANIPYTEPDESRAHRLILFLKYLRDIF
jgi:hypothetical protein